MGRDFIAEGREGVEPKFDEIQEGDFQTWYGAHAETHGLAPDPDDWRHFYDYRAAYLNAAEPDETGHWPSEYKTAGHPNRYVEGMDTKTGQPAEGFDFVSAGMPPGYDFIQAAKEKAQETWQTHDPRMADPGRTTTGKVASHLKRWWKGVDDRGPTDQPGPMLIPWRLTEETSPRFGEGEDERVIHPAARTLVNLGLSAPEFVGGLGRMAGRAVETPVRAAIGSAAATYADVAESDILGRGMEAIGAPEGLRRAAAGFKASGKAAREFGRGQFAEGREAGGGTVAEGLHMGWEFIRAKLQVAEALPGALEAMGVPMPQALDNMHQYLQDRGITYQEFVKEFEQAPFEKLLAVFVGIHGAKVRGAPQGIDPATGKVQRAYPPIMRPRSVEFERGYQPGAKYLKGQGPIRAPLPKGAAEGYRLPKKTLGQMTPLEVKEKWEPRFRREAKLHRLIKGFRRGEEARALKRKADLKAEEMRGEAEGPRQTRPVEGPKAVPPPDVKPKPDKDLGRIDVEAEVEPPEADPAAGLRKQIAELEAYRAELIAKGKKTRNKFTRESAENGAANLKEGIASLRERLAKLEGAEAEPTPRRNKLTQKYRHFTLEGSGEKIREGGYKREGIESPYRRGPQGNFDKPVEDFYPKDTIFLSLDDPFWASTRRPLEGGEWVKATAEAHKKYDPLIESGEAELRFNYDTQTYEIGLKTSERVVLEGVEASVNRDARVLKVDSAKAVNKLHEIAGSTDATQPGFWKKVSEAYDIVEVRNAQKLGRREAPVPKMGGRNNWRFFDQMTRDQLIVLNKDAISWTKEAKAPPKPRPKPTTDLKKAAGIETIEHEKWKPGMRVKGTPQHGGGGTISEVFRTDKGVERATIKWDDGKFGKGTTQSVDLAKLVELAGEEPKGWAVGDKVRWKNASNRWESAFVQEVGTDKAGKPIYVISRTRGGKKGRRTVSEDQLRPQFIRRKGKAPTFKAVEAPESPTADPKGFMQWVAAQGGIKNEKGSKAAQEGIRENWGRGSDEVPKLYNTKGATVQEWATRLSEEGGWPHEFKSHSEAVAWLEEQLSGGGKPMKEVKTFDPPDLAPGERWRLLELGEDVEKFGLVKDKDAGAQLIHDRLYGREGLADQKVKPKDGDILLLDEPDALGSVFWKEYMTEAGREGDINYPHVFRVKIDKANNQMILQDGGTVRIPLTKDGKLVTPDVPGGTTTIPAVRLGTLGEKFPVTRRGRKPIRLKPKPKPKAKPKGPVHPLSKIGARVRVANIEQLAKDGLNYPRSVGKVVKRFESEGGEQAVMVKFKELDDPVRLVVSDLEKPGPAKKAPRAIDERHQPIQDAIDAVQADYDAGKTVPKDIADAYSRAKHMIDQHRTKSVNYSDHSVAEALKNFKGKGQPSLKDAAKAVDEAKIEREAGEKADAKLDKAREEDAEAGQGSMFDAEGNRKAQAKREADAKAEAEDAAQGGLFGEAKPEETVPAKRFIVVKKSKGRGKEGYRPIGIEPMTETDALRFFEKEGFTKATHEIVEVIPKPKTRQQREGGMKLFPGKGKGKGKGDKLGQPIEEPQKPRGDYGKPIRTHAEQVDSMLDRPAPAERKGMCLKGAWEEGLQNGGRIVHGTVIGNRGERIKHAWVEKSDGTIYDPQMDRHYSEDFYRAQLKPQTTVVMEPGWVTRIAMDKGMWEFMDETTYRAAIDGYLGRKKERGSFRKRGPTKIKETPQDAGTRLWDDKLMARREQDHLPAPTEIPDQIPKDAKPRAEEADLLPSVGRSGRAPRYGAGSKGWWERKRVGALKNRRQMTEDVMKAAYTSIRAGRLVGRSAAGYFEVIPRLIRMRSTWGHNLATVAHEAGHAIQRLLMPEHPMPGMEVRNLENFKPLWKEAKEIKKQLAHLTKTRKSFGRKKDYLNARKPLNARAAVLKEQLAQAVAANKELELGGKKIYGKNRPAGGYKSEGFAEFVRLWMEDRNEAKKLYPNFYSIFLDRLYTDPATLRAGRILDMVARDWAEYRKAPALARLMSKVESSGGARREMKLSRLYAAMMDEYNPMQTLTRRIYGTDPEHGLGNPYSHIRAFRGWRGAAEAFVYHGQTTLQINPFLRKLNVLDILTDDVVAGRAPAWKIPQRKGKLDSDVNAIARSLQYFERDGLLERKGEDYFVTDAGRAEVKKFMPVKTGPALAEILRPVAGPLDRITDEALNGPQVLRDLVEQKFGNKFLDRGNRDLRMFTAYIVAKHAKTLEKRGIVSGFTATEIEAGLALEKASFKKALDQLQTYQENLLMEMVHEGIYSIEQFEAMRRVNPFYIPFKRLFSESEPGKRGTKGENILGQSKPFRKMKGADMQIQNPLETIIENTFIVVNRIKANQIVRMLHEYAQDNPGSGWAANLVKKKKIPTGFRLSEITGDVIRGMHRAGVPEEFFDSTDRASIKTALDAIQSRVFRYEKRAPNGIAAYWRDGKQVFLEVDKDVYNMLAGLDRDTAHVILRILGPPARLLRAGATLNPSFMIKNMIRDALSAGVYARYGFTPGVDSVKGMTSRVMHDDHYFRWIVGGGSQATIVAMDRNYLKNATFRITQTQGFRDRMRRKGLGTFTNPIETLRNLSEIVEEGTRVGVYRRAMEAQNYDQNSLIRSIIESRDATLDFQRFGYVMREYNRMNAFLNAQFQGVDKLGRTMHKAFKDPAEFTRFNAALFKYIVAPSMLTFFLNRNNPEYDALDDYMKDLHWNFPTGGRDPAFLSFPKPHETAVLFGSLVERSLHSMYRADPDAMDGWFNSLLDALVPDMVPTFLVPIWANSANYRWPGRPVESERERRLDPEMRFGPYTTESSKAIAAMARKFPIPLINPARPASQVSPREIDNMIRSWTGGLGNILVHQAVDPVVKRTTQFLMPKTAERLGIGEKLTGTRPFVQRYLGTFMVSEDKLGRGEVDRYYRALDDAKRTYDSFMAKDDADAMAYVKDKQKVKMLVRYEALSKGKNDLSVLNAQMREAIKAKDRKKQLDVWRRIRTAVRAAMDAADIAEQDETALEAIWMGYEARKMQQEEQGRRGPFRLIIEDFVINRDYPGFLAWLKDEVKDGSDQQWAMRVWKRLVAAQGTTAIERKESSSSVPKKIRLKAREKAAERVQ